MPSWSMAGAATEPRSRATSSARGAARTLAGDSPLFDGTERIRDDVRVPVLTIQSETDVIKLGGIGARQPDAERLRLWEVAGAAHFDVVWAGRVPA